MQDQLAMGDSSSDAPEEDSMMESKQNGSSDYLEESFPDIMKDSGSKKDFKWNEVQDSDSAAAVDEPAEGGKKDSESKRPRPTSAARTGPTDVILKRSKSDELKMLAEEIRQGSKNKNNTWVTRLEQYARITNG